MPENCTTCEHGIPHVYATGEASGKTICTKHASGNYTGWIIPDGLLAVPWRCWTKRKDKTDAK